MLPTRSTANPSRARLFRIKLPRVASSSVIKILIEGSRLQHYPGLDDNDRRRRQRSPIVISSPNAEYLPQAQVHLIVWLPPEFHLIFYDNIDGNCGQATDKL